MKIIFSNFKKGDVKVKITSSDDFWYLSQVLDQKDIVKGETYRKIKVGKGDNQDIVKKPVFLSIEVEKTDFQKQKAFRISGTILEGPEDVPKGSHHTFNVEVNDVITIEKNKWFDYQVEKINEACSEAQSKILLVIFDRDEAHFAYATNYGYEYISELKSDLPKKGEESREGHYYEEIISKIKEYVSRYSIEKVVVGSPSFWKDYLLKQVKDDLKKKIIVASCSSADKTAFNEVLKRPEVETALRETRAVEELNLVEELLKEIMKEGLAKYGFNEVETAVNMGAVRTLLITDSYIKKMRDENDFEKINLLLKKVDSTKGKIKIISSEHDGGKKLNGLGGIAVLLRYKID